MTANELADGILAIEERIFLTKKEHQLFQNSAKMLRNQQAEIEALKKEAALQRLSDFTQEVETKYSVTSMEDEVFHNAILRSSKLISKGFLKKNDS